MSVSSTKTLVRLLKMARHLRTVSHSTVVSSLVRCAVQDYQVLVFHCFSGW